MKSSYPRKQQFDTCIVCCYFNPRNSSRRFQNFIRFYSALAEKNLPVAVIELTFPGQKSALSDWAPTNYHIVRDGAVLWQKERLLNRLVSQLPSNFTKVAWVDVDLIFSEYPSRWLEEISELLEQHVVVQGFGSVHRLPRYEFFSGFTNVATGFIKNWSVNGRPAKTSNDYREHGHTGYAWAARRSFFSECGLYDSCLSGSADHLMAHAFIGELDSPCYLKQFRQNEYYFDNFLFWAERVNSAIGSSVAYADVVIEHMWHGSTRSRKYKKRDIELADSGFLPDIHMELKKQGTWGWSTTGEKYMRWAEDYYTHRKEP